MSIFVSIACLLDPDIVNTIRDCFDKAYYKNRIKIGIYYQKDFNKPDLLEPLEKLYNLKIIRISWDQAQGPMYARNRILSLITDEKYFFQIDCHTRFFQDWDQKIIHEYNLALEQSKNPVISYYPININNVDNPSHTSKIYHIATFREISKKGVKTSGRIINVPIKPKKGIGVTAAMLFMPCKVVLEVPIDPNLPFALHSGEQLLYAIRLWTRGYDFFTPSQHIISTEYITNKERIHLKYRSVLNKKSNNISPYVWKKVKYLLGLTTLNEVPDKYKKPNDQIWMEGNIRTLKDYYLMVGIYNKLKTIFPYMRI